MTPTWMIQGGVKLANVELFGTYFRLAENLHLVWLFEQLIIELT